MITALESQIARYGEQARARLAPKFAAQQIAYPPYQVTLMAIKASKELLVCCSLKDQPLIHVTTYQILGASGRLGPKMREGDRQVPEGIYNLSLQPKSSYHLALRLNYPNQSDLARARSDGRSELGSDILIHGSDQSVGCLAVGDETVEDLFVLVHDAKAKPTTLVIVPTDFRDGTTPPKHPDDPAWLPELYSELSEAVRAFPRSYF